MARPASRLVEQAAEQPTSCWAINAIAEERLAA